VNFEVKSGAALSFGLSPIRLLWHQVRNVSESTLCECLAHFFFVWFDIIINQFKLALMNEQSNVA